MRISLKYFIPGILWFIFVTILLTLPGDDIPKVQALDKIYFDKIVHTGLFCALVLLFYWPVSRSSFPFDKKRNILFKIALAALAYGIAMEFVQKYFIPNRTCDVTDMIADGVGGFLPYFFQKMVDKIIFSPKKRQMAT